jgi:hypothetical protein
MNNRQSFYLNSENLDIFNLLENKSSYINDTLDNLRREVLARKKIIERMDDPDRKFKADSSTKDLLHFVVINKKVYELEKYGLNSYLFKNTLVDRILAIMLINEMLVD